MTLQMSSWPHTIFSPFIAQIAVYALLISYTGVLLKQPTSCTKISIYLVKLIVCFVIIAFYDCICDIDVYQGKTSQNYYLDGALYNNLLLFIIRFSLRTCPMPAPMLPLPSMIPVTVAIALSLPSMGPPRPATDKHPQRLGQFSLMVQDVLAWTILLGPWRTSVTHNKLEVYNYEHLYISRI